VHRAAVFYAGAAWLLVQVATQVFPFFDIPNATVRIVVIAAMIGFPFALLFSWFYEWTPQGLKLESEIDRSAPLATGAGKKLDKAIIAVLSLAVALLLLNQFVLHRFMPGADATTAAASDKSIAVLPFENLSDDKANAYFAVGVQDEILTRLAKIGALKVISRTSTMHYASSPDNLPDIARQLGVAHILEGSVQKSGDQVRITVQLILASTDAHLWAETYDRKLTDIFSIQSEVARAIADALQATLSKGERQELAREPTTNTQAYEAYLRGLAMEGRYSASTDDTRKRIETYEAAVALDPGFAAAWALLAQARTELYFQSDTTPEALARAKRALDQAARLAPDASETSEARGMYEYYGLSDYDAAFDAYSAALRAKPNAGSILYSMGNVRRRQSRWNEAVALQTQASELDPLNTQTWFNLGLTLRALRRYDDAIQAFDRGLAAVPGDPALIAEKVATEQARGNWSAASKLAEQLPLDSTDLSVVRTRIEQWLYEHQNARAIAELKQVLQRRAQLDPVFVAGALLALGTTELLNNDRDTGIAHLTESRNLIETAQRAGNVSVWDYLFLGPATAALGDRTASYRYAERGAAGLAKDAIGLPQLKSMQAYVYLQAGDKAAALKLLAEALALPTVFGVSPATLRVDQNFDALRDDPRFAKMLADADVAAKQPFTQ
jgi:TolB-like protein/Tfp pilus assembly protein PilF